MSIIDDGNIALIRQRCTRIGCIMDDNSVIALVRDDGLSMDARPAKRSAAANAIQTLVAAARALMPN